MKKAFEEKLVQEYVMHYGSTKDLVYNLGPDWEVILLKSLRDAWNDGYATGFTDEREFAQELVNKGFIEEWEA